MSTIVDRTCYFFFSEIFSPTLVSTEFLNNRPEPLWEPPTFLFIGHVGSFLRVKRPGPEVDHSLLFRAEVKNEWCEMCGSFKMFPESLYI
jgi:hypothetical protein